MPAEERRDEIRGAEDVEAGGEDAAREAVHDAVEGRYLGLVDCEMGTVGTVLALGDEDRVAVCWGEFFCCDGSDTNLVLARYLLDVGGDDGRGHTGFAKTIQEQAVSGYS